MVYSFLTKLRGYGIKNGETKGSILSWFLVHDALHTTAQDSPRKGIRFDER